MVVTLQDGRITRIDGDPLNTATGGHVCLKGISYARRVTTGDRLLHPLKRQRDGSFARVSWDEALTDIAARLDALRRSRGPESVLYYEASGSHGALGRLAMAFWHQFGGCTLTYGDLCWPAGLEATRLTFGTVLHSHPRHTADSRYILLWGHNPAETNVHQMRWIHEAQERGAIVALIDPRGTDTADAADVHLQPRPGTDAALALGMARVIVDAGLHDVAFLGRHAHGLERYLDRLRDYPLERVAAITGLPATVVNRLARDYARHKPALIIAGFGLQRHHRAGQTMRAVALLAALTGNIGVGGGGWQYANLNSHCLQDPPLPPEPAGLRRAIPVSRLGPALAEIDAPRIAAVWVEKGNPVSQNPRSSSVRKAFEDLALLVVVDQFMTDTARLAHYVLPAKTMFEQEDLVTAYWHPYLQLRAKLWDPPGEVKTESEIWRLLSERLGFDPSYFPRDDVETRALLAGMLPSALPGLATASGLDTRSEQGFPSPPAEPAGGLRRGLAEAPGAKAGSPAHRLFSLLSAQPVDPTGAGDVAFGDLAFRTPSGKVEFASEEASRLWGVDAVPDYVPLDEGHESALVSRYPLQLLSCKTRDRIHSQFGNLDWIRDVERPHQLDMHPQDARARGLLEGDEAVVWNDRGRLTLLVRLDEGLRPGVVHVLEGRCHEGDPDINVLTDAGVTDMNHGATFYECLVEVKHVSRRSMSVGPDAGQSELTQSVGLDAGQSELTRSVGPDAGQSELTRPVGPDAGQSELTQSVGARSKVPEAGSREPEAGTNPPSRVTGAGFVLDLGRCVGCAACVLACRLENGWSSKSPWRRVLPLNLRRRPGGPTYFFSVACHHCERPACVAACPSRAYEKRADGVVIHHEARCIGCRYCEMACPFGAPRYDQSKGVMAKCDYCRHESTGRADRPASPSDQAGASPHTPACVAACPTEALRVLQAAGGSDTFAEAMPGFTDPAGCRPTIRFVSPRGARRAALLRALHDRLDRK
jgi:anaerobic selenocysteine-containing dehydrogenase/Fe-S-cluster-containing dehydrogenase component